MKKLIFLLAVAVMVTPAMALVTISGVDNEDGTLTISYTTSEGDLPRGIALLLSCSDTLEITGYVADSADDKMNCFIDYAYSNDPYDLGMEGQHPLADPANPGEATLPAAEVSVCMGALDETENQLPGDPDGDIATLTYTGAGDLTIAADTLRGPDSGVVGSELASNLSDGGTVVMLAVGGGEPPLLTVETAIDPIDGFNYYQAWLDAGSPNCWAYPRQCRGDANGTKEGSSYLGYYYVGVNDLNLLATAWKVKEPDKGPGIDTIPDGICADFDHRLEGSSYLGYYHVGVNDLNRMTVSWKVKEPDKGPGIPADCGGTFEPEI